jgi:hypothetical protein
LFCQLASRHFGQLDLYEVSFSSAHSLRNVAAKAELDAALVHER